MGAARRPEAVQRSSAVGCPQRSGARERRDRRSAASGEHWTVAHDQRPRPGRPVSCRCCLLRGEASLTGRAQPSTRPNRRRLTFTSAPPQLRGYPDLRERRLAPGSSVARRPARPRPPAAAATTVGRSAAKAPRQTPHGLIVCGCGGGAAAGPRGRRLHKCRRRRR